MKQFTKYILFLFLLSCTKSLDHRRLHQCYDLKGFPKEVKAYISEQERSQYEAKYDCHCIAVQ